MKLTLPQGWEVSDAEAKLILEQILAQLVSTQEGIEDLTLTHGEIDYIKTKNLTSEDLLQELLNQLKIMNMHLSVLSREEFKQGDI